ncbi:MAG: 3-oxoacyl-acyl-carrier protein reductase [Xanthobacteraceae bacterium]|nr:MAG: 3-oxoacyl-acyl-carrier protein reductase [Xanthobacteraceae bacterium]
MRIDLTGRLALVTGAAQGIGQAIALELKAAGAAIVAADLDGEGVGAFASAIVVNAAGGVRGQVGRPIAEVEERDWKVLFEANVDGAFWLAQAASAPMARAGFGRIVNIASGAGLRPSLTGIQAYTAAKHALVGLTKQLSQDLGPMGITCNAVAPGFVRSNPATERQWKAYGAEGQKRLVDSIHTRRLGTAADIAHAVVFLASEQAAWISGQILSVDGGRS